MISGITEVNDKLLTTHSKPLTLPVRLFDFDRVGALLIRVLACRCAERDALANCGRAAEAPSFGKGESGFLGQTQ